MTKNSPVKHILLPTEQSKNAGSLLVREEKVAAIVLAGGHGSRFGYHAPKGCYPISPIQKKSIYQLLAERVLNTGKRLPLAFMTSDATHEATCKHFEENDYFGLDRELVSFFMQKNLPLRDEAGNLLPETAPDGNGALFWHFDKLHTWEEKGISHVTVMTIDNVLADPFQLDLIGYNAFHSSDVTVVGIMREDPKEHVGVLLEQEGKLRVIEYSELDDSEKLATSPSGSLMYPLANISYFAFSMTFIKKVLTHTPADLPLHQAKKKVKIDGKEITCFKSEYFIFDLLNFTDKAKVLLLPRSDYFAPLKTKESIQDAQKALENHGIL